MKRLAAILGILVVTAHLTGCDSGTASAPPTTDPKQNWPDEVKEAEAKIENMGKKQAPKK